MKVGDAEIIPKAATTTLSRHPLPFHILSHACVEFVRHLKLFSIYKNCDHPGQLTTNRTCPYDIKRTGTTTLLLSSESIPPKDSIYTMSLYSCNQWKWESDDLSSSSYFIRRAPTRPTWPSLAKYDRRHMDHEYNNNKKVSTIRGTTILFEGLYHGIADAFHNFFVPLLYALNPRNTGYEVDYIWIEHGCSENGQVQSRDPNPMSSLHRILLQAALNAFAPTITVLHRPCDSEYEYRSCFERLLILNAHSDFGRHTGGDPLDLFHDEFSADVATHHVERLRVELVKMFHLEERVGWRESLARNQTAILNVLVYYRKDASNGRVLLPGRKRIESMVKARFNNKVRLVFTHLDEMKLPTSTKEASPFFQTFYDTDLFISTHGSALTNVLFMKPNSAVWEVSSFSWIQSCQHGNLCDKLRLICCQAKNPNQRQDVPDTTVLTDRILHRKAVKNCIEEWLMQDSVFHLIVKD